MNLIYKLFLTINSTLWVVVIYGIKEEWTVSTLPSWVSGIILLFVPVILSAISILFTLLLGKDNLKTCGMLEEANSSFLPTYLGYFFVGLGVEKYQHLIFVYLVIFIFTYVAQAQYYNPMYLLFGYRYYHAETEQGTQVFLIVRKNLRKASDAKFDNLRRINDTTYIAWRDK
ncbi:MAG: hypothetical protein Ta2B_13530 [Termitinemataceae bacterium]|nr:MAG: hypothetical protein Ta2B_13530 [Termitinemataceae bacterium]